jgi:hypothetical protein
MWGMFIGPHSQAGQNTSVSRLFMKPGGTRLEVEADRFEGRAFDQLAALWPERVSEVSDERQLYAAIEPACVPPAGTDAFSRNRDRIPAEQKSGNAAMLQYFALVERQ